MFDVFDPESIRGRVYRALIADARQSVTQLVENTALPEPDVRKTLEQLEEDSMVVRLDRASELWDAERPDIAAANTMRRYQERVAGMHRAESELMELFQFVRRNGSSGDGVEVLSGVDVVFERFRTMQESARERVRAIDRPPYYWDEAEISRQERLQSDQMAAGIKYRTIYQESESDAPRRNASMIRTVSAGECARVLTDPPVKITIIDDQMALFAADPPASAPDSLVAYFLYPSFLLTAFTSVFESLWRLAVPINLDSLKHDLNGREHRVLTLMASGATDDAIARRLNLSRRTVVRDVAKLLEQLGATTRFQAGVQAARRGWL